MVLILHSCLQLFEPNVRVSQPNVSSFRSLVSEPNVSASELNADP